jgi:hypothetical protein
MFRCRSCAILRELTVPGELCYANVTGAEDSEVGV